MLIDQVTYMANEKLARHSAVRRQGGKSRNRPNRVDETYHQLMLDRSGETHPWRIGGLGETAKRVHAIDASDESKTSPDSQMIAWSSYRLLHRHHSFDRRLDLSPFPALFQTPWLAMASNDNNVQFVFRKKV
jgi:hypothetical protein